MEVVRSRSLLAPAAVAVCCALAAAAAGAHPARVVVRQALLYKPSELTISGDGDVIVRALRWRSWGGRTATGSGRAVEQERPSHVNHSYPATVTLSRRTYCAGVHRTVYNDITVRIAGPTAGVFGTRTFRRVYNCAGTFRFS